MSLTAQKMKQAFESLDQHLTKSVRLVVGGGGAMLLAHQYPLSTSDVDAVPAAGVSIEELDPLIKLVAKELNLPSDWLNPYFSTFAHVLPADYGSRLVDVFSFRRLKVQALSKEDLLIMKCFAARQKDVTHARVLVRQGADLALVKKQIRHLNERKIPGCDRAAKFLAEIEAFFEDQGDE